MVQYGLLALPLIFAVLAIRTNYYPFKAAVTLSCLGIIFLNLFSDGFEDNSFLMIVTAFGFSIAGDFFLSHRREKGEKSSIWFVYGIALFFLAHIFYLAYVSRSSDLGIAPLLILLIPFLLYYLFRLLPHLEDYPMKIAVFLYLVISCFSLAAVIGFRADTFSTICMITGIGLIVFSDTCIAESNFVGLEFLDKLILPTYYAAHGVITLGLVRG